MIPGTHQIFNDPNYPTQSVQEQSMILGNNFDTLGNTESIKFTALKEVSRLTAPAGFRLSRVINKGTGSTSYGAFIPSLSVDEIDTLITNDSVKVAIQGMLESIQDKIIRVSLSASEDKEVLASDISPEMIIAFIKTEQEAASESFRLSGEKIAAWFSTELSALLAAAIRAKTPTISDKLLAETLESFSKHFQILARKEVSMKEPVKKQLEKALALLPDDHSNTVTEAISKKLADASEASVDLNAL